MKQNVRCFSWLLRRGHSPGLLAALRKPSAKEARLTSEWDEASDGPKECRRTSACLGHLWNAKEHLARLLNVF